MKKALKSNRRKLRQRRYLNDIHRQTGFLTPKSKRMSVRRIMGFMLDDDPSQRVASPEYIHQSKANKDLALAFRRFPFRLQRVARALKKGASFKTFIPFPTVGSDPNHPDWQAWSVLRFSLQMSPIYGRWASFWSNKDYFGWDYDEWDEAYPINHTLWDWMKEAGVDFNVKSSDGESFLQKAFLVGNTSALMWLKKQGLSFKSPQDEFSLDQIAIVNDKLNMIEGFDALFPDEALSDSLKESLKQTRELIVKRWSRKNDETGFPLFTDRARIRARIALANAAFWIAHSENDAVQAHNQLSEMMDALGIRRSVTQIKELETKAKIKKERDELEKCLPPASGKRSSRL